MYTHVLAHFATTKFSLCIDGNMTSCQGQSIKEQVRQSEVVWTRKRTIVKDCW